MTDANESNRLSGRFGNGTVDNAVLTGESRRSDQQAWFDLTGFQRDLLRAIRAVQLSDEDPKGLAIKAKVEEWYGEEVNHGRLYPNLDTIRTKGLIEKDELDKRTNAYTLSTRGGQLLANRVRLDAADLRIRSEAAAVNLARADGGTNNGGDN